MISPDFNTQYVHSVYFWLHFPSSNEDRTQFEKALNEFLKTSQYAKTSFVGTPPKAERTTVDDSYTYMLLVTFPSKEEHDKYQEELPHTKFVNETSHLWEKVQIYDANGIV